MYTCVVYSLRNICNVLCCTNVHRSVQNLLCLYTVECTPILYYAVQMYFGTCFIVLRCTNVHRSVQNLLCLYTVECNPVLYYAVQLYLETCSDCTLLSVHLCCTLCILPRGQNRFYHIGQSVGGMLAPVLPRPGVATLRCCHPPVFPPCVPLFPFRWPCMCAPHSEGPLVRRRMWRKGGRRTVPSPLLF